MKAIATVLAVVLLSACATRPPTPIVSQVIEPAGAAVPYQQRASADQVQGATSRVEATEPITMFTMDMAGEADCLSMVVAYGADQRAQLVEGALHEGQAASLVAGMTLHVAPAALKAQGPDTPLLPVVTDDGYAGAICQADFGRLAALP